MNVKEYKDASGNVTGGKTTAFVKMSSQKDMQKAIQVLDGDRFFGSNFNLDYWKDISQIKNEAKEKTIQESQNLFKAIAGMMGQK